MAFMKNTLSIIVGLLALASSPSSNATAVYKYTDKSGIINYTNKTPPHGVGARVVMTYCFACDPHSKVDWNQTGLNTNSFNTEIKTALAAHPIDEALVRAIMHAESAYNPDALSKAGAVGLMQLMPAKASEFGINDRYDPAQNIAGGVQFLEFLLNLFDGDVELVMASYNAGENAVMKYSGVPPYAETQVYVKRVGILYQRYRQELAKSSSS
jgi:soluble lytic murein transglycosylase-like protein